MSWGIKITILYLGFVGLIVAMVAMSSREKVDLVSKDYYEQELGFQERLNRSERSNALTVPLTWEVSPGSIQLNFPEEFSGKKISGSVYLFRPSDASMDKTMNIEGNELKKLFHTKGIPKGIYKMEVNWNVNGQEYYNEGIINLN